MKRNIRVHLPDVDRVRERLVVSTPASFTESAMAAAQRLEGARAHYAAASRTVEEARGDLGAGKSSPEYLTAALQEQRSAALQMQPAEREVEAAHRALEAATHRARMSLIEEAIQIRDELQRVADDIAPSLNAIRELESALDHAVRAVAVPGFNSVPAVTWPSCLNEDCRLASFANATRTPLAVK